MAVGIAGLLIGPEPAGAQNPTASAAPLPNAVISYRQLDGPMDNVTVLGPHIVYGGELTVDSELLTGNLYSGVYDLSGHVTLHDADTWLLADSFEADGPRSEAIASQSLFVHPPYSFTAGRLLIQPGALHGTDVTLTTAPPNKKAAYEVRAQSLDLYPAKHDAVLENASLYLFRARLVTLPHVVLKLGSNSGASRAAVIPVLGVSNRYGEYIKQEGSLPFRNTSYRLLVSVRRPVALHLAADQELLHFRTDNVPADSLVQEHDYLDALHALASSDRSPLPQSDPLLFHDILPDQNPISVFEGEPRPRLGLSEVVETDQAASGRLHDDLYVSKLPEVTLSGSIPVTPASPMPTGDPNAFRSWLRHVVLVAVGQVSQGYYQEQPTHTQAAREQGVAAVQIQPLLIAPNTVVRPFSQITADYYSRRPHSFAYFQAGLAVNHYFSNMSAVGAQFTASAESGDSPFDFDVPDTSRELDLRLQMGNRKFAAAGDMRLDLVHGAVIDYRLSLAPGLIGVTPVLSYNFQNRSFGIGAFLPEWHF